jgi:hypothetical protein
MLVWKCFKEVSAIERLRRVLKKTCRPEIAATAERTCQEPREEVSLPFNSKL